MWTLTMTVSRMSLPVHQRRSKMVKKVSAITQLHRLSRTMIVTLLQTPFPSSMVGAKKAQNRIKFNCEIYSFSQSSSGTKPSEKIVLSSDEYFNSSVFKFQNPQAPSSVKGRQRTSTVGNWIMCAPYYC